MVREAFKLLVWATQANLFGWLFAIFGAVFADSAPPACAAWMTGDSFARQLDLPVEIHWQDARLQESLQRLASAQGVAIMLDRRIDPGQQITTSFVQSKLLDALRSLAESHGWGVSVVSPVVYVGPLETTQSMATWHRQQQALVNQLPPAWQRRWRRTSPCEWPEPTEPRALMARWLSEAHIPAAGLDQIPHDLWAARELPPLDMLQRLVITLAGFQLAPRVNADGSVTIVPLSSETTVTDAYRLPPQRLGEIDQLRSELPGAQLTLRQRTLTVVGRAEDHDRVRDWLQGQQRRTPSGGSLADKRFTLTVQNQPIAAILQAVAQQLDLELVWHDATQSWREDRVSLSVKNATLGELITTVLEGRSARYRLQGRRLIIAPASSAER